MIIKGNKSNPKLVFVIHQPTKVDLKKEEVFYPIYFENKTLRQAVNHIGLSIDEVAVVYLTEETNKIKHYDINKYKDELFEYLKLLSEDVLIVPVGSIPTQTVLNIKNISNVSGSIKKRFIDKDKGKYTVIPIISPYSILKNKSLKQNFLRSINVIKAYLNGELNNNSDFKYRIIKPDEIELFTEKLIESKNKVDFLFYDIETSSLSFKDVEVIGVSILTPTGNTCYYIPLYSNDATIKISELDRIKIKKCIKDILKTYSIVGHNVKFDVVMTSKNITDLNDVKIYNDTMIMAHIVDNNKYGSIGLKNLAKIHFNLVEEWDKVIEDYRKEYARTHKMKYKDVSYAVVPTQVLAKYACLDVYYTRELYNLYNRYIKNNPDFKKLNDNLINEEMAICKWEYFGAKININKYKELKNYIEDRLSTAIYKLNNLPLIKKEFSSFNPNSPKQIAEVIKMYKLPIIKKTKSGNPSTDADTLEKYLNMDSIIGESKEFIKYLYQYKFYNKAKSSYINPLVRDVDDEGIFRTSFNICGTVTGRVSSYLHTLPSRTSLGKNFKHLIESRFGEKGFILSADFSQLEPRTLASLSGDKNLIKVYEEGKDIYKFMASEVYHKEYEDVTKDERNSMKALVLAIMYGMSPSTFAERVGCSQEEAEAIFDNFFYKFRDVKLFIDKVHRYGFKHEGIKTPHGRFIPINTYNYNDAKRKMQNYIIQSTASELALFQFSQVTNSIFDNKYKSMVVNSVHDSIVIDVYISEFLDVYNILMFHCNKIIPIKYPFIKVPMVLDASIGDSWGNSLDIIKIDVNKKELIVEGNKHALNSLLDRKCFEVINVIEERNVDLDDGLLWVDDTEGVYKLKYIL